MQFLKKNNMNIVRQNEMQIYGRGAPSPLGDKHSYFVSVWLVPLALAFLLSGCGCSEDEPACQEDEDCETNFRCAQGECVFDITGSSSDSGTTSMGADTTTDTDSNSDTTTEPAGTDSESDSPLCSTIGTLSNGLACTDDCGCASQHCQNGFCCLNGECCQDATDCNDDLCASATCQNGSCVYTALPYSCGTEDIGGQTCSNGYVCDGNRNCIPVVPSECGLYAPTNSVSCTSLDATYGCHDSCTLATVNTDCVDGSSCVNGNCESILAKENGNICLQDGDCLSGHCGDGFCCAAGECCSTQTDCSDECKSDVQCGTNSQCFSSSLGCGYEDANGDETCTGANRCDGTGNCISVTTCVDLGIFFGSNDSFTCGNGAVTENCFSTCTSNGQCGDGNQCVLGACLVSNGGTCLGNQDCASDHCSNGRCCDAGNCCAQNTDCDTPCQTNGVCNTDLFQCVLSGDAEACGTQNDGCSDLNRCDGQGNCVAVTDHCSGTGEDTYTCATSEVVRNCRCNFNTDCDLDDTFCNGSFLCGANGLCKYDTPVDACSIETPCYTNVSCNELENSCSGTNPCDALATECDAKLCIDDGGGGYFCAPNKRPDTTFCNDGNLCNGSSDSCIDGLCIPGPPNAAFCFDDNPCTEDDCTENDTDTPTCENTTISIGSSCAPEYNCYGDNGTCEINPVDSIITCTPVEVPCNNNGVCSLHQCTEDFANDGTTCFETPNISYRVIACGEKITLTPSDFATRVYTNYTGPNDFDTDTEFDCQAAIDDPFIGKEAIIYVQTNDTDDVVANLEISSVDTEGYTEEDFDFLLFDDANICNWGTCTARQTGGYTGIPLLAGELSPEIIIDSRAKYFPPTTLELSLSCN